MDVVKLSDMGAIVNYHEACSLLRQAYEILWEVAKEEKYVELEALVFLAAMTQKIAEDLDLVRSDSITDTKRRELHTDRQKKIEVALQNIMGLMQTFPKKAEPLQKGEPPSWYFKYNQDLLKKIQDALVYPND
jgi:hypothetical protein